MKAIWKYPLDYEHFLLDTTGALSKDIASDLINMALKAA
jgi:hypothetical protein